MAKPRKKMLNVGSSIVCWAERFKYPSESPAIPMLIESFDHHLKFWAESASAEERETIIRFMDGETIYCRDNWINLKVPNSAFRGCSTKFHEKMMDDQACVDYLFLKNDNLCFARLQELYPCDIRIVPGSKRLIRVGHGNRRELGKYRSFVVGFDTEVRMLKKVPDLTAEEIKSTFRLRKSVCGKSLPDLFCAIKACAKNFERIYCGKDDWFINFKPACSEDVERLFLEEMKHPYNRYNATIFRYGVDYAKDEEERKAFLDGIRYFGGAMDSKNVTKLFGVPQRNNYGVTILRIPHARKRPWMFVKIVRKGVEACQEYLERCKARRMVENFKFKEGCFELEVDFAQPYLPLSEEDGTPKMMCDFAKGVIRHIEEPLPFLKVAADFVESLLDGTRDESVMWDNLFLKMRDSIAIDPANFVSSNDYAVKKYALYCLNGSF